MRQLLRVFLGSLAVATVIQGCASNPGTQEATEPTETTTATTAAAGSGTLTIKANGEDFVRQGFVTKDGWEIQFDHVYVTLAEVTAYQSDPPFDPDSDASIQAQETVKSDAAVTVDLAAGNADAEPIQVTSLEAPAGRYNALSWKMVGDAEGPAGGYPLVLQGTATKAGQTIDFTIQVAEELSFVCGDYVGEERKGMLTATDQADLEATFHFDHLFGDGEAPPDDEINTGALGFEPFAALAESGQVTADSQTLQQELPAAEYEKFMEILPSLGHVGEGHCDETDLAA
ncbi:uncharacterized protein XM38_020760 [Halomicronema hongdechloris C2206]|uniref:DUF4382 domain-containing protein n=1 Tax=Halomicronema hongdechloris C2206 TaxID=1641165 RepID=A0A1Z3HLH7_9CYAN|nr:DUF4382 domain-containing protein [Halomicronema hongdechloris]ASC71126.1 uncharacterized protein XM38_020760 [Halomicronema hongdechloris C2206]